MKHLKLNNTTIQQLLDLGFDFSTLDIQTPFEDQLDSIMDFVNDKAEDLPQEEDECEINSHGSTQSVSYYNFVSSGHIVDFSDNWQKSPETKIFHSNFVFQKENGEFSQMNLYYLVGETEYNAPDGYYYDPKQKCHVEYSTETE
jgi:hypothetical protein